MRRATGLLLLALAVLVLGLVGLALWQARDPVGEAPGGGFDLAAFFEGTSVSTGTVRTALVSQTAFTAAFRGRREGKTFRLEERFAFEDGERLQVWTLTDARNGQLTGTVETERKDGTLAPPVPVAGVSDDRGIVLDYDGYAPGGGDLVLHFRHAMRAQGDGTVSNHVVVSKYGIPVATSAVTFAKAPGALSSPARRR